MSTLASQLGGMTSYNELCSSCNSYYKEIVELLETLEETFVIKLLRPFHKSRKTELGKNPKVYFVDLGLRNHSISNFNELEKRGDRGEIAENFVLNQLVSREAGKLNYWRTLGKAEVDFVLAAKLFQLRSNSKKFTKPRVSRSFKSFISAYEPRRAVILTKDYWGKTGIGKTRVYFIPIYYI